MDLVDFINEQEEKIQQIEDRQHEIYRESSSRKRKIKNEEQYREYQIWHVEVQEELDEYYGAAEPPVRCGESHLSGLTEPLRSL